MLLPTLMAAFAAIASVSAQDVTVTARECLTRYAYYPLPASLTAVPTNTTTFTNIQTVTVTSTTRDTVTVTPDATTFSDVLTSTATIVTTTTFTPAPSTVPTPAGFIALRSSCKARPTAASRIMRGLDSRGLLGVDFFKRQQQTAANHTGGYIIDRNGNGTSFNRKYPRRVDCTITYKIERTNVIVVTGLPETVVVAPATATALSTTTVSSTQTVTVLAPRETIYQACQDNNIANYIWDDNGEKLWFNRIIYTPIAGLPVENELLVKKKTAKECCIACQTTANCAGSFLVPTKEECHLRLTQPPPPPPPAQPANNSDFNGTWPSYPTASGMFTPSGIVATPYPMSTGTVGGVQNSNATCGAGSSSLDLGTVQGEEDFPEEVALYVSNGPCGRLCVQSEPVDNVNDFPPPPA